MIKLRALIPADIAAIMRWPSYPPEFEDLDYALRSDGWLKEFWNKPDTWCYAVDQADELVAFSILSKTGETEGEFRIALRADKTGQGLGGTFANLILANGFTEIGLTRIHLIARKNNPVAINLYKRLGFNEGGDCFKSINGKQVHFLTMDLIRVTGQSSFQVYNRE